MSSYSQHPNPLIAICEEYRRISEYDLENAIKKEVSLT
jgi:hypothetical protein